MKAKTFILLMGIHLTMALNSFTKSRLLLDFSRGAQRVSPIRRLYELEAPPVCCGLLLGWDGQGVSK